MYCCLITSMTPRVVRRRAGMTGSDMNDSVIFTDNIAYAFRLKEGEVQLYKAEYVDTADVWKYKFEGKPLETLKKVAAE